MQDEWDASLRVFEREWGAKECCPPPLPRAMWVFVLLVEHRSKGAPCKAPPHPDRGVRDFADIVRDVLAEGYEEPCTQRDEVCRGRVGDCTILWTSGTCRSCGLGRCQ